MNTHFTGVDRQAYARDMRARRFSQGVPQSYAAAVASQRGDALLTPAASKLAAFLQLQRASGR